MTTPYPFLEILDGVPIECAGEPQVVHAGDTVKWRRMMRDYPSATFTLSYVIINRLGSYRVEGSQVVPDPDGGGGFAIAVPATVTATWAAGHYRWQAYISDADGDRYTVGEGVLEVLPNLQAQAGGYDDREQCEKDLDNVRALLSGKYTEDAQRYTIRGRELQRYTIPELRKLKGQLEREVRAARIRRGEKVRSRSIGVRFGR